MSNTPAVFEYAKEQYSNEVARLHAFEEKVMRYQAIVGAILSVGAFGFERIQFLVLEAPQDPLRAVLLLLLGITLVGALTGLCATMNGIQVVDIGLPPIGDETLSSLGQLPRMDKAFSELAHGFAKATRDLRLLSNERGRAARIAWCATLISALSGGLFLLLALGLPFPHGQ